MFSHKSSVVAVGIVLALAVAAVSGDASDMSKRTSLTFSKAVSLPGVTLAAGTYVFEVANPLSGHNVVMVRSKEDYRHVYFMGFTYLIDRPEGLARIVRSSSVKRRPARRRQSSPGSRAAPPGTSSSIAVNRKGAPASAVRRAPSFCATANRRRRRSLPSRTDWC